MATPARTAFNLEKTDSAAPIAPTRTQLFLKWLSKNRLLLITTALAAAAAIAVVVVSLFFPPAMLTLALLILASMPAYAAFGTGAAAAAIATAAIVTGAAVYSLSGLGALVTFGVTKGYNAVISRRRGSSEDNHSDDVALEDRTELLAAPSRPSTFATFLATQFRRLRGIGKFAPLASEVEQRTNEPLPPAAASQASSASLLASGLELTAASSAAVPSEPGQVYPSTAHLGRTSPASAAADQQRARTSSDTIGGTPAVSPGRSRHSLLAVPPVNASNEPLLPLSLTEEEPRASSPKTLG